MNKLKESRLLKTFQMYGMFMFNLKYLQPISSYKPLKDVMGGYKPGQNGGVQNSVNTQKHSIL